MELAGAEARRTGRLPASVLREPLSLPGRLKAHHPALPLPEFHDRPLLAFG